MNEHRLEPSQLGLDAAARFGLAHVAGGCGMGAALIFAGKVIPGAGVAVQIGWILGAVSIVLAMVPRMTGRKDWAETASALSLSALSAALAAVTGGLSSPFLIWLFAAPVQAAVTGARGAVGVSAVASALGLFIVGLAQTGNSLPPSVLPQEGVVAIAILAASAALGAIVWSLLDAMKAAAAAVPPVLQLADPVSDASPDLILRLSPDMRIASASAASRRLLGLDPQEVEGLSPGVLVHIAEFQTLQTLLSDVAKTEDVVSTQVRLRRKDGVFVWCEFAARTDGPYVVASVRDVSVRRAQEEALMGEAAAALEHSKSKSRFLANMSHELRTPLNAIIGFSDMIRQEVFGPVGHARYREYAGHIHSSGQHLVDMISDLLDMSKIEAGKFKLSLAPVDLGGVIDESIDMLKLQASEAGVGVSALLPRDMPAPMADRRAIKQIMLNLLSNAIKFTPAQGRIVVAVRRDGSEVLLEVRDTGVGIPEADLARIGKPFEQAGDPLRDMQKGTGLGLSLVAALAGLHGGRMHIDSAPGDGTTVTVTLPIHPKSDGGADTVVFPEKFRVGGKG